ncbi:MAG: 2-isopropylmalate synthase [Actinobacteria bacterium]|nr:2-isopropylmalate synthase [Actinomycetota bacterium]
MARKVYIFDTTMRDGEQTAGVTLTFNEKLELARQLANLNVDVIEAGFPFSSPGDFKAVEAIAEQIKGPIICALARALPQDIDRAYEALRKAEKPRIHTFISTSDIQIKHQLRKTREEVLEMAVSAVKRAKSYVTDVEFSAMDATRSDWDFLCTIFEAAIKAGATVINIPDTVGYTLPSEFYELVKYVIENTKGIDDVIVSVHCHNDLGLATANSLAAIEAGATQVECTVNGIGERAGNAALEEVVMIIDTRKDRIDAFTDINISEIARTSKLVSRLTGVYVQPNKAIVGENAFAHQSGIHQDAVLKERTTFEIIDPKKIGFIESKIVLGKLSGRHALKTRLEELGYFLNEEDLNKAFQRFKELADRKKEITDRDLEAIVSADVKVPSEHFKLSYIQVTTGNRVIPTATVALEKNGQSFISSSTGDGPVDAAYRAIDNITGFKCRLQNFSVQAVTSGQDALGEVQVQLDIEGISVTGRGISTDIVESSVRAYVNAINRYLTIIKQAEEQDNG